jgi:hypothetical protein
MLQVHLEYNSISFQPFPLINLCSSDCHKYPCEHKFLFDDESPRTPMLTSSRHVVEKDFHETVDFPIGIKGVGLFQFSIIQVYSTHDIMTTMCAQFKM